jgi:inosine-uridine nucleoside N-ribohydrolase
MRSISAFWMTCLATLSASLALSGGAIAQPIAPPPTKVIFDTDMWGDIDDVLALAMLNALQDRHEVDLLAVTVSTDDAWIAPYVDLLDVFYGRGDVPVGVVHHGVPPNPSWLTAAKPGRPNYTKYISQLRKPDGSYLYPHRLTDRSDVPDAVALLRRTLAAQPDGSVVVIQVGFSTNLARLLDSGPDQASPLTGTDLVRKKVRLLSAMGGNYSDTTGKILGQGQSEFNLAFDVPAAQKVFSSWPTPIVASGFEIGRTMSFKGADIDSKFGYVLHHPVAETYRYTDPAFRSKDTPPGTLHDHQTWDMTSVLYAARPDDGYFTLSRPGTITVLPGGTSRFEESASGTRRYLIMNDAQRARALEAMTLLSSEPPTAKHGR